MSTNTAPRENKMGVMPVNKLLLSMALPMIASMLVQALYNVVDSIFVAKISEDALTAVSLIFPIQNLMIAIGTGTGVGINALLSRSLGERNYREVNSAATNGLFLAFVNFLVFVVVGLTCSRVFFQVQTDNPDIIRYGQDYMVICCVASAGLFGQITFERLLQSTGLTMYSMVTQGVGAIVNIILDPILIFGLFGLPRMEVAGAALATVIGQTCGMLTGLYLNRRKNKEIQLQFKGFRPRGATIKRIYSVGLPSIIMLSISSVMIFGINRILLAFTSTATAVFGVYFKLQSFVFMPVLGLNNGIVPILSYNYGAQKKERMIKTIKLGIAYAVGIMLAGLIVFQLIPGVLLSMFNASDDMIAIGSVALRRISLSFLFAGFCIVAGTVFQSLGHGVLSMFVSITRQLIVLLPCAFLLSRTGVLDLVWFAFPIAELASVVVSALFLRRVYRTVIQPMPDTPPSLDQAANAVNPS